MAKKDEELRWEDHTARFELRISPLFLKAVDEWRRQQDDLPSRAEAIRRMVLFAAKESKRK